MLQVCVVFVCKCVGVCVCVRTGGKSENKLTACGASQYACGACDFVDAVRP